MSKVSFTCKVINNTVHVLAHFSFAPVFSLTLVSTLLDCSFDTITKTGEVLLANFSVLALVSITLEVASFYYRSQLLDYVLFYMGDISQLFNIEFRQLACKLTITVCAEL